MDVIVTNGFWFCFSDGLSRIMAFRAALLKEYALYFIPPYLFLWGFVKDTLYSNDLHALEELPSTKLTADGI